MQSEALDFRLLFESSPDVLLVLLPDAPRFTIVAATHARLLATHTSYEQNIGRGLFELFPDNPDDPAATGARNLRLSLERVLATRAPDTMAVQKYDIRGPDGSYQVKHWSPKNLPVLAPTGELRYILHRVEDVTELVHVSELGEELRDRNRQMEREVVSRSRELSEVVAELRAVNAKLGELDAAKTAFFSNVSHEFRTPLTLMLGPIEDALADPLEPLTAQQQARIRLAHDNALRLYRLVNSLLNFSRLEAGRLRAHYAPLDIASFTAKLAAMFQSAVDKMGLCLRIDCPPLSEPVWVDQDLWEKIVPNLVSNALKFTHAGEIAVRLREDATQVVLEVADTGIGIPEAELPHVFERFYRVSGAHGRTYEGTGIGLSLVREMAALHGGTVSVASEVGRGATFRVAIPKGYAHLPQDSVSHQATEQHIGRDITAQVTEAVRWDDGSAKVDVGATAMLAAGRPCSQVLVADDNADLREYLSGLLAPHYAVITATDGIAALEAIQLHKPDIVVSDVMMPRLDGFGLVRALRAQAETASLPVILLSARAGEESAIDGLDAGADDYLVKPFSARELLARVRTHVQLAQARHAWIAKLETANRELDAFSYSVAHDLRAPLMAIEGFTQLLTEDYASTIDKTGHSYLDNIRTGLQRMNTLINALLDLARVGRSPLNAGSVDLSALAKEAITDLQRTHPLRQVSVAIADTLVVKGDHNLLNVALVNLLSNAWKFTAKRLQAHIEVGRHDATTFVVRDNGVGFDMSQAEELFVPFNRLHSQSEFGGTGIGLTTVQRVIERHGGRVWAEAQPGRGASFYFSLPQR